MGVNLMAEENEDTIDENEGLTGCGGNAATISSARQ